MSELSALNSWLKVSTWHTNHPLDEERFYKAIHQVILHNGLLEPNTIKNYITDFVGSEKNNSFYEDAINQYVERYDVVYSFLYENKIRL